MKVMKFGGTSVGSPSRMMDVTELVTKSGEPVFVVLSAMAGTTNSLVEISDYLYKKNPDGANEVINQLERMYMKHVEELYSTEEMKSQKEEHILVNKTARDCISNVYAQFPDSSIAFATSISDQFSLHTNKLYLVRSLRELLYNAAKYSDGKHIILRVAKIGKMLRFVVEDKGPGIDKAYMNQMFVPFTKVNNLSEGLGLGLPLSKRHAENLGGDLIIDTSYIEGCRIILELPI